MVNAPAKDISPALLSNTNMPFAEMLLSSVVVKPPVPLFVISKLLESLIVPEMFSAEPLFIISASAPLVITPLTSNAPVPLF